MADREPPYPPDTRAKGWRFELDLERIAQSDTWALAGPQVRPWLLMLWTVAWQQTPCGSMPAEDELIVARLGIHPSFFAENKGVMMRRWWRASDGRLYHDVLAGQVLGMLEKRRVEAERQSNWRAKRSGDGPSDSASRRRGMSRVTTTGHERDSGDSDADVMREHGVSYDTSTSTRTSNLGGEPPKTPSAGAPGTGDHASAPAGQDGAADAGAAGAAKADAATRPKPTPRKPPDGAMEGLEVPDWMPAEAWADFVAMRRSMGKSIPFTLAAARGIVRKVTELRDQGQDPWGVLEQSTRNGWRDVFALKAQGLQRPAGAAPHKYAGAVRAIFGAPAAGEVFDA